MVYALFGPGVPKCQQSRDGEGMLGRQKRLNDVCLQFLSAAAFFRQRRDFTFAHTR